MNAVCVQHHKIIKLSVSATKHFFRKGQIKMDGFELDLTTAQMRNLMHLRKLYESYPDSLGTKDVQQMLGIGRGSVLQMKDSGLLKCFKIGNKLIFPKEWILEYLVVYAMESNASTEDYRRRVLRFCRTRKTITQIALHLNLSVSFCRKYILEKLCDEGKLVCEIDRSEPTRHCYVTKRI
jgi:hypothetical protein